MTLSTSIPTEQAGLEGSTIGLHPMTAAAADVTAWVPTTDTYELAIPRWDSWFPDGRRNGITVTRKSFATQTAQSRTQYYWEFAPKNFTHTAVITMSLHGAERRGTFILQEFMRVYLADTIPALRQIRNNTRLVVVFANPDGYTAGSRTNQNATRPVDINRNWTTDHVPYVDVWADYAAGTFGDPSYDSERDKGTAPYSEPETANLKSLVDTLYPDTTAWIDWHALSGALNDAAIFTGGVTDLMLPNTAMQWAAEATFGPGRSSYIHANMSAGAVLPLSSMHMAGRGIWSCTPEFGPLALLDIATTTGMAKGVNFAGNVLLALATMPNQSYARSRQPKSYEIISDDIITIPSTQTTWATVSELTIEVPIEAAGLVVANYKIVTDPSSAAGTIGWVAPYIGQNKAPFDKNSALYRDGGEVAYHSPESEADARQVLSCTATRPCFPSDKNSAALAVTPFTIGLQARVSGTSGFYTIRYAAITALVIPADSALIEMYRNVSGTLTRIYPE